MSEVRSSTTPRTTSTRRTTRYRAAARSVPSARKAPLVVELGSTLLRVGYADSAQPLHMIAIPPEDPAASTCSSNTSKPGTSLTLSESQWYSAWMPWIDTIYDRLMCNPKTRKVVVVHPQPFVPRAWQTALEQIFWNKGVPAVTFVSALEVIPVAQGWKRGLVVHLSRTEAVCVCHADGHMLPFTFQSVPDCGYANLLDQPDTLQTAWTPKMDYLLLDELHNPNALVVAILKCLEQCPRDVRCDAVQNMVVCGEGVSIIPDVGRRLAKRLEQILEAEPPAFPVPSDSLLESLEGEGARRLVSVPIPVPSLQTLAARLRLLASAPYRPDFLPWVGASLWVASWNRYQEDESKIPWKTAPKE